MPRQGHVDPAPLSFEVMCAATWRAATKVKDTDAAADCVFHERPVQKHVGCETARLAQRPRPRHLELSAPYEATASGERLLPAVHHAEHDEIGKRRREALKQRARQHRCAKIPHRSREHLVKRFALLGSEPDFESFFHWAANLTA